jgi:ATP synthase assembly factor FMC1, mitochondrial
MNICPVSCRVTGRQVNDEVWCLVSLREVQALIEPRTSSNIHHQFFPSHTAVSPITMSVQAAKARSLYRQFLRELPSRSPSILANPSPIQNHVRADFSSTDNSSSKSQQSQLEAAEQHIQYLKAQRMYITLLERYNPGANMNEEERVRLTARRVGMDLPIEMQQGGGNSGKE